MATELRRRRGSALQNETFTGAQGEITIDLTNNAPVVHDGVTVGGFRATMRNEIVGTVSQSGGAPTGAIIERGSNSNGEYVKFADGTLICTARREFTTNSASNLGRVSDRVEWIFPENFLTSRVVVTGSAENTGLICLAVSSGAATQSRTNLLMFLLDTTTDDSRTLNLHCFGRWY